MWGSLIAWTCVQNLYNELQLFLHFPVQGKCAAFSGRVRNIFDIFLVPQVPFIHRRENLARINGTASLKRSGVIECSHCSVPVDSRNVPKSTSRRFRHFKHFLRSFFEVEKKKDSLREQQMRPVRFLFE
jgi:hypothetical protein